MLFKLPREGLTLEALFSPLEILLQPIVTGLLLLTMNWQPEQSTSWSGLWGFARDHGAHNWCAVLLGAGIFYQTNRWFSRRYLNGYTESFKWDHTKELVVITGGSSGIGAAVASRLANDGTKVIILDIQPPLHKTGSNTSESEMDMMLTSHSEKCCLLRDRHIFYSCN